MSTDQDGYSAIFFFGFFATTQLVRKVQQERLQVVCSNREAQKRPATLLFIFFFFWVFNPHS